jgi:hypothetical protein
MVKQAPRRWRLTSSARSSMCSRQRILLRHQKRARAPNYPEFGRPFSPALIPPSPTVLASVLCAVRVGGLEEHLPEHAARASTANTEGDGERLPSESYQAVLMISLVASVVLPCRRRCHTTVDRRKDGDGRVVGRLPVTHRRSRPRNWTGTWPDPWGSPHRRAPEPLGASGSGAKERSCSRQMWRRRVTTPRVFIPPITRARSRAHDCLKRMVVWSAGRGSNSSTAIFACMREVRQQPATAGASRWIKSLGPTWKWGEQSALKGQWIMRPRRGLLANGAHRSLARRWPQGWHGEGSSWAAMRQ